MDRSPDIIRAQMSVTRASLDRRLDRIAAKIESWRPSRAIPEAWDRASPYAAVGAVAAGAALLLGNIVWIRMHRRA